MVSVTWHFNIPRFPILEFDIEILNEPDNNDGLYLQFYEGNINGVSFYFGIQTDIIKPRQGFVGRGFLFSRWNTRDLTNARPIEGGWTESSGHESNFIGVRCRYDWTVHRYRFTIRHMESDEIGDWYGVWIEDLDEGTNELKGALRFPKVDPDIAGIAQGGTTWIELYDSRNENMANWHIKINEVLANNAYLPIEITSDWSDNVVFLNDDNVVHLIQSEHGGKVAKRSIYVAQ